MTRILMIAGLIAITLNLLSCAVQTREKANGLSKGMEEQLTNSVESFKSSPIYTDLTEEIIDTT